MAYRSDGTYGPMASSASSDDQRELAAVTIRGALEAAAIAKVRIFEKVRLFQTHGQGATADTVAAAAAATAATVVHRASTTSRNVAASSNLSGTSTAAMVAVSEVADGGGGVSSNGMDLDLELFSDL
jgi:hypothetical protein